MRMADIKIGRSIIGSVQTNVYFVYREDLKQAIVFDPADQGQRLFEALKNNGLTVAGICLTHGHFDHILGVAKLRQLSHCEIYASALEETVLSDERLNCSADTGRIATVTADHLLGDGEEFELGGIRVKLLSTPGHTEGSCCYYIEEAEAVISGDTLFEMSVGRTDLPTGSMSAIVRSIKEKLMILPDDTRVFPGHGGDTTIGFERVNNPFLG